MGLFVVGLDIGGTNIKAGLINSLGRVILRANFPTKSFLRNKNKLIEAILLSYRHIMGDHHLTRKDILGFGIGLPGLVDMKTGIVRTLTNIPHFKNIPLKRVLEKQLRKPVVIDNDVNVMALGEWKFGAGRGCANMFCLTLGTGVGGGMIINNELYRGQGFTAGEFGHIPLNEKGPRCNCGGYGCLEQYVGNRPLLRKARKVFKDKEMTLENISQLAIQGDCRALKFWQEVALHLGNGLVGIINLLNPGRIVIGGGVANAYPFMLKTIRAIVKERALKIPTQMAQIVQAQLGEDAGIVGAQVLVKHALALR